MIVFLIAFIIALFIILAVTKFAIQIGVGKKITWTQAGVVWIITQVTWVLLYIFASFLLLI